MNFKMPQNFKNFTVTRYNMQLKHFLDLQTCKQN